MDKGTKIGNEAEKMYEAFNLLSFDKLDNNIKMFHVMRYYDMKLRNPAKTKKDICRSLNISLPTLNKYFKETQMGGFVRKRTNKNSNLSEEKTDLKESSFRLKDKTNVKNKNEKTKGGYKSKNDIESIESEPDN